MFTSWNEFTCMVANTPCRAKAEDQAWVEVSQFYNSYKENSESALKRRPPVSAKAKGKQRATDAEIWVTMGRELPLQFQGHKGVDMALQLIEEVSTSVGSSTKLKERLASVELKVRLIRSGPIFLLKCIVCSWKPSTGGLERR
jgi:kinetochore protein Mis13/DSN1